MTKPPPYTALGVEVSADRYAVWIALAGEGDRGAVVELLDPVDPFKVDAVETVIALTAQHPVTVVAVNPHGNGATLVDPLQARGVAAAAAGQFGDGEGVGDYSMTAPSPERCGTADIGTSPRRSGSLSDAGPRPGRSTWTGAPPGTRRRWSRPNLPCTDWPPATSGRNCSSGTRTRRTSELVRRQRGHSCREGRS